MLCTSPYPFLQCSEVQASARHKKGGPGHGQHCCAALSEVFHCLLNVLKILQSDTVLYLVLPVCCTSRGNACGTAHLVPQHVWCCSTPAGAAEKAPKKPPGPLSTDLCDASCGDSLPEKVTLPSGLVYQVCSVATPWMWGPLTLTLCIRFLLQ